MWASSAAAASPSVGISNPGPSLPNPNSAIRRRRNSSASFLDFVPDDSRIWRPLCRNRIIQKGEWAWRYTPPRSMTMGSNMRDEQAYGAAGGNIDHLLASGARLPPDGRP
jgi:hypothetical protein